MKPLNATAGSVALCCMTLVTILAHDVTYEGTVAAIRPNRYVASSGIVATLSVHVSGRKRPMAFDITQTTKLVRGNSTVSFADAHIEKDEPVAVTVNHDEPGQGAIEVRLTQK